MLHHQNVNSNFKINQKIIIQLHIYTNSIIGRCCLIIVYLYLILIPEKHIRDLHIQLSGEGKVRSLFHSA